MEMFVHDACAAKGISSSSDPDALLRVSCNAAGVYIRCFVHVLGSFLVNPGTDVVHDRVAPIVAGTLVSHPREQPLP